MAKKKTAWDQLSMRERSAFIRLGLNNSISDLKQIRDTYNIYSSGGSIGRKFDGEQVGQSQELVSLAKPTAQQITFSGFESPLAISQINQDVVQDYITRFTQEHPHIRQTDLLASLSNVPLYEGSLGNGVVAAWMSGKQDQYGNFTHGVAFDKHQSNDKEINTGNATLFVKAPKNALEHELLGHGVRDIALGSTSGSTDREKEVIGNAYPFLQRNVYSHYNQDQAQHLLAEQLATNTQLRAMLQQNTGLYGKAFNKYVDSMSYEDLYNSLYTLNSGYYSNSDLSKFFDYNVKYTENELNKINELQVQLQKIRDERDKLAYDIYEERQNENVRKILGNKYDSYFKDREKRKQKYDAQELEVQDQLYKLKNTLGIKNYENANQIEAIKNALKTVAYNTTNPFEVSNNTYLAAFGGPLTHKKSGKEQDESSYIQVPSSTQIATPQVITPVPYTYENKPYNSGVITEDKKGKLLSKLKSYNDSPLMTMLRFIDPTGLLSVPDAFLDLHHLYITPTTQRTYFDYLNGLASIPSLIPGYNFIGDAMKVKNWRQGMDVANKVIDNMLWKLPSAMTDMKQAQEQAQSNWHQMGPVNDHKKSGEEQGETQYLKLDDSANYQAYQDANNYFLNLGFGPELAAKYAVDKVHNNITFDAGMLPEVTVTAKAWGDGDDASRRENYQKAQQDKREALQNIEQAAFNQNIRNATDKWGKGIGLGMTALAALPVASGAMAGMNALRASYPIATGLWDASWATDGIIRNLFTDQGVRKTYNLAKQGDAWGAVKSGAGDALDLLGFLDMFNVASSGYKYFKHKPNLGTVLWDALPQSAQMPTRRATELLLRQGSGPINDIPLWLKQFSTDPEFRKYIFTGQRPSNRTLGQLSTGNLYNGYQGYFASDRVDETHDLISAYLYGNKLDPSIAKHISTGQVDDFGALRSYITSNYADKMSQIPVYDTGIGYLNGMWDPNPVPYQAYVTQQGSIPYPYNRPHDFYTADMQGKIDVGGHTVQQGVWHLDNDIPVFRGLDIWKFNPKDYMKKWSNPNQPFSVGQKLLYKTGVEFLDAMGTPFITRTNWTIDPRVPLPNDFDRQQHRFIVNHLEQNGNIKSTGGPLYPFSFEKNPFLKTPVVRYEDGGQKYDASNPGGYTDQQLNSNYQIWKTFDPTGGLDFWNYVASKNKGNRARGEENEYWKEYMGLHSAVPPMNPNAHTEWDKKVEEQKIQNGELTSDFYGTTPRMDYNIQALADTLMLGKMLRNYDQYQNQYSQEYRLPHIETINQMYEQAKTILNNPNQWTQVTGEIPIGGYRYDSKTSETNPLGMLSKFGMKWVPEEKALYMHDTYNFPDRVHKRTDIPVRPREMKIRSRINFDPLKGSWFFRDPVNYNTNIPITVTND